MSDTEVNTDAPEEDHAAAASSSEAAASTSEEKRPKRTAKPNPKYDENEQKRREIARIRKEEVGSIQKVMLEINQKMEDRDLEAVRALSGTVDKKLVKLLKTQELYVKSDISKTKKESSENELEMLNRNYEEIKRWLEAREDIVEEESESESEGEDKVDLKKLLQAFKRQNEKLIDSQTKMVTEIASALRDSMIAPKQDIAKFDGNPRSYHKFWSSFEAATKAISDDHAKLNYLIQNCVGEAKDAIDELIILEPAEGLQEAKSILSKRYGRPHVIVRSYVDELTDGAPLKRNDSEALSRLALLMNKSKISLKKMGYEADLNSSETLLKIARRLPDNLRAKWAGRVDSILEQGDEANFDNMLNFVERHARITTNMFGHDMAKSAAKDKRTPQNPPRGRTFATSKNDQPQEPATTQCAYCSGEHQMWRCDEFARLPVTDRKAATRSRGLCDNCFQKGHVSRECPKRKFCSVQGCTTRYKHSTLLHPSYSPAPKQNQNVPLQNQPNIPTGHTYSATSSAAVCLKVVPVKIVTDSGELQTFALLDNCSDVTMCSKGLLRKLWIRGRDEQVSLNTVSGKAQRKVVQKAKLKISSLDNYERLDLDEVWAVDDLNIPSDCIARQSDITRLPHFAGIELSPTSAEKIELLIGGNHPSVFWTLDERRGARNEPIAVKTIFGWTATGPVKRRGQKAVFNSNFVRLSLDENLRRMWQTEFNDIPSLRPAMSVEDHEALNLMSRSTKKDGGHYEVSLPWRHDPPPLPNNRQMAETRLQSLKRRMKKDPDLHSRYTAEMTKYLDQGFAEEVKHEHSSVQWYLPHHSVTHPRKPDKVRVVFDCSASYKGSSLNQELLQGPDLMNDLSGVLMRFRQHPVALSADIEAMFHQVRVTPKDTDALRFLWWKDGDITQEPTEYRMRVHLFGATSSPSVCCFALRKTAEDNAHLYSSETIEAVLRNFYMDDCLKSVETIEEAIKIQEELRNLLARGGFRLTKWMSNNKDVIHAVPESERAPSVQSLAIDELPTERTLGVEWKIESDTFQFTPQLKSKPTTKRGILSTVSSLFDPLGFVAPVTLTAKSILQELCRKNVDWDEEIEESIAERWCEWLQNLPALTSVSVPRCYRPPNFRTVSTELHHFSDASELGYGAVSYLRFVDTTGEIHCSIVVGKSRLAPIKTISIPRLELSAAVVAVRLNTMIREQLTLSIDKTTFWTDSTAVLQYIRNRNKRFKTYVANRLTAIHEGSNVAQWKHVGTKQNPADLASRGLVPTESDKLEIWQRGPEFLWMDEKHWPTQPATLPPLPDNDDEVKRENNSFFAQRATDDTTLGDVIEAHSSWYRLQKAIAWMTRFKQYCVHKYSRGKPTPDTGLLTVRDLQNATLDIAKYVQNETWKNDIEKLQANPTKRSKGNLRKLNPIIQDGVLRVGGRLENALIPESQKHPIILPGNHHATELLLRQHHAALGHSGSDMVLNSVRKQFWVTSGKHAIRRIISRCVKCRRKSAPFGEQIMAPLPAVRVTPNKPPFSATGVDYFGPIYVKQGRSEVKRYGCLFTCLATRAVHLEVAHSMTTDSFLGALHRFISRRGQPDIMYSDNGTNFTSANKELKNSLRALDQAKIYDNLRLKQIEWKFNPPAASHMGGAWERMIRTTRRILDMLLGEQRLHDECLLTFMAEVERIINDRPLTAPSSDTSDPLPLSPNDLLLLRSNASIPTGIYDKLSCYTRRWYHQAQYLANVFWKRWVREYLPTLQKREKWQTVQRNFQANDIVLVSDEQIPRGKWPLGKILETYPDKHGLVRTVKVKTASGVRVRPIDKICLLEGAI